MTSAKKRKKKRMIDFGPEPVYEPEGGYGEGEHPDEHILKILDKKKKQKKKKKKINLVKKAKS